MRSLGRAATLVQSASAARAAAVVLRAESSPVVQSVRGAHVTAFPKATLSRGAMTVAATAPSQLRTATQMALAQARRCMSTASETTKELSWLAKLSAKSAAYPTVTGVVVTLVRTAPCDIFGQTYLEGRELSCEVIDWRRFMGFMIFGGLYVGVFQTYLYRYVINAANLTMLTGLTSKAPIVFANAMVDTFIHSPFMYLPLFWLTMRAVNNTTPPETWIPATYAKWKANVFEVSMASATLWLPAQILNFYFMPQHLMVPFINLVGVFWVVYLSLKEGMTKDEAPKEEEMLAKAE